MVISRSAVKITAPSSSREIPDSELADLSSVLHWSRGCSRGLRQKKAFLLQGIEQGLFSTTYPFLPGGLRAFNYCASCRCTANEEVLKRFQEEHRAQVEQSATASSSVPSETTVSRRGRLVWQLPIECKLTFGITSGGVRNF